MGRSSLDLRPRTLAHPGAVNNAPAAARLARSVQGRRVRSDARSAGTDRRRRPRRTWACGGFGLARHRLHAGRAGRRHDPSSARQHGQFAHDGVLPPLGHRRCGARRRRAARFPADHRLCDEPPGLRGGAHRAPDPWRREAAADDARALATLQPAVLQPDHAQARRDAAKRRAALSLPLRGVSRRRRTASSPRCAISRPAQSKRSPRAISSPRAAGRARCRRHWARAGKGARCSTITSTSSSGSRTCGRTPSSARPRSTCSSIRSCAIRP